MTKINKHPKDSGHAYTPSADIYRLLASCFYPPQKNLFQKERLFENLHSLVKVSMPEVSSSYEHLSACFDQSSEDELTVIYSELFVGPFELAAPPYGSVYLDGARRVMGDSTIETMKLYEAAGLVLDDIQKEAPDHIAIELEFLYYLTIKSIEAVSKGDNELFVQFEDIRSEFINNFLGKWVGPFCQNIREKTTNSFYLALSDCLESSISCLRKR
jgi:TorA maturation chaperone TorD